VATYVKIMMKMSCVVITAVLFKGEDSGCVKRGEINPRSSYGICGIWGKIDYMQYDNDVLQY
jgi:hypothetical protein